MIEKTGKLNLNPLIFNGLAIAFLLLIAPLSIAYATTSNIADEDRSYYNTMASSQPGLTTFLSSYMEIPNDYQSELYQLNSGTNAGDFRCAHILPARENLFPLPNQTALSYYRGFCAGENPNGDLPIPAYETQSRTVVYADSGLGSRPYINYPSIFTAGNPPPAYQVNGFVYNDAKSTDGTLSMSFRSAGGFNISESATGSLSGIRIKMLNDVDNYPCSDEKFDPLFIEFNFELTQANSVHYISDTYQYSLESNAVENSQGTCNPYFEIEAKINYLESLEIDDLFTNGIQNANPNMIININKIETQSGNNNQEFYLPFVSDNFFKMTVEASSYDGVQLNAQVNYTLVFLSIIMGYLAIASTPYYDPLRNFFKGVIE